MQLLEHCGWRWGAGAGPARSAPLPSPAALQPVLWLASIATFVFENGYCIIVKLNLVLFWSSSSGMVFSTGFIYSRHVCVLITKCWILDVLKDYFNIFLCFLSWNVKPLCGYLSNIELTQLMADIHHFLRGNSGSWHLFYRGTGRSEFSAYTTQRPTWMWRSFTHMYHSAGILHNVLEEWKKHVFIISSMFISIFIY